MSPASQAIVNPYGSRSLGSCDTDSHSASETLSPILPFSGRRHTGVTNIVTLTREQITNRDFSPVLNRFDPAKLPVGHELSAMMGRYSIRYSGFSSPDSAPLRQDVREYLCLLDTVWPYWAYFLTADCGMQVFSSIANIEIWRTHGGPYQRRQIFDQEIVADLLNRALSHLIAIAGKADLSTLQVIHRCVAVILDCKDYYLDSECLYLGSSIEKVLMYLAWPQAVSICEH